MAQDGSNAQVLLKGENSINCPRSVCSDKKGEQLTVINNHGREIMNYKIYKVI